jgi:hypothetical protein
MLYRKDFMKLAGLGLAALFLPKIGDNEMDLGDVAEKIANQARLTPEEKDFWKMSMRQTQLRNTFVAAQSDTGPDNDLSVGLIKARRGQFDTPPISGSLYTTSDFTAFGQSFVNNTNTVLTSVWEESYENQDSIVFAYDLPNGKFQFNPILVTNNKAVLVLIGHMDFNLGISAASVIETNMWVEFFRKSDDTSIFLLPLAGLRGISFSFFEVLSINNVQLGGIPLANTYFTINVRQENGSDLLGCANVVFFKVI